MTNGFSYKPYNIPIYMYRFTWLFCTQNFWGSFRQCQMPK